MKIEYTPQSIRKAALDEFIKTEGFEVIVYLDTLGNPTVGIGHLVRPKDNLKVGDVITEKQVEEFFDEDITPVIEAAIKQAKEIGEEQLFFVMSLLQVNYQLGIHWPRKWPNTYGKLCEGNFDDAIRAIQKSRWRRQTPRRANAFINVLKQARDDGDNKCFLKRWNQWLKN